MSEPTIDAIDPYCLAHGKRQSEHEHGRCLYCCICFNQLTPETCAVDTDGIKWDVCPGECARDSGLVERDSQVEHMATRHQ